MAVSVICQTRDLGPSRDIVFAASEEVVQRTMIVLWKRDDGLDGRDCQSAELPSKAIGISSGITESPVSRSIQPGYLSIQQNRHLVLSSTLAESTI